MRLKNGGLFVRLQKHTSPCAINSGWTTYWHVDTSWWNAALQIHTQSSSATCGSDKRLRLSSGDMADVFITSLAELPGLLTAALLVDFLGRKRCAACSEQRTCRH